MEKEGNGSTGGAETKRPGLPGCQPTMAYPASKPLPMRCQVHMMTHCVCGVLWADCGLSGVGVEDQLSCHSGINSSTPFPVSLMAARKPSLEGGSSACSTCSVRRRGWRRPRRQRPELNQFRFGHIRDIALPTRRTQTGGPECEARAIFRANSRNPNKCGERLSRR